LAQIANKNFRHDQISLIPDCTINAQDGVNFGQRCCLQPVIFAAERQFANVSVDAIRHTAACPMNKARCFGAFRQDNG